jgi:hypothetical protein
METATILAIIALCGTVITGAFQLFGKLKKFKSGCVECEGHNNIEEVVEEVIERQEHELEELRRESNNNIDKIDTDSFDSVESHINGIPKKS